MSVNNDGKPNKLKPRWRKVLSDLWGDKTRTALVVASIGVGVFAVGMILTALVLLSADINTSYITTNPANIQISTAPIQKDLVRVIEKMPSVDQVEGRQTLAAPARRGNENWQPVTLINVTGLKANHLNQTDPLAGKQVPARNEIVFSDSLMKSTGFQIGDQIEIKLSDGATHALTVVGLVNDQQDSFFAGAGANTNGFVTQDTFRSMGIEDHFNRLLITVDGDGGDKDYISEVADDVSAKLESHNIGVYQVAESRSDKAPATDTITAIVGALLVLGVLILFLSSSLIFNTINALLLQQLRQIGVMKLVGGRSIQILGMYVSLILAYCLIAMVIAIPLGIIVGYGFANFAATALGAELQGFRIVPLAVIAQVAIAILIPLGAGFFPIQKGAKTKIRRAISDFRPQGETTKRSIFNTGGRLVRWVSRPTMLSFRNTFRKKGRLILTVFALTMAGAIFIAVFNTRVSMQELVSQLTKSLSGDIVIFFDQPYGLSQVERELSAIPGIAEIEGWSSASAKVVDQTGEEVTDLVVYAPPLDTQLLDLEMIAGRWLAPGDRKTLVVGEDIYDDYPDLQPGETLFVEFNGGKAEPWEVVGIFDSASAFGNPTVYTSYDYVSRKSGTAHQARSYRLTTKTSSSQALASVIQNISQHLEGQGYQVNNIIAGNLQRGNATSGVDTLIVILLFMALLTAFVGGIGLMGTMSINVLERTREIGVMRTIGAVDAAIMKSVIIEGLFIGMITWLLAIGLSFPISFVLLKVMGQAMAGAQIAFVFTFQGVFIWLGVVIVLSIIASILPARNAARLTINEVLAYE